MRTIRAILLAALLALAGCGTHRAPAAGGCAAPPPGIGPGADATVQVADDGRRICLGVGQELTVYLKAGSTPDPRWSPIITSDPSVLRTQSSGVLTPVIGVTPGVFRAVAPGTVQLQSSLSGAQPRTWSVVVVIR